MFDRSGTRSRGQLNCHIMTTALARTPGEVFTRRWIVETMLDLAGYTADNDLAEWRVVEPSLGSGAFMIVLVERLLDHAAAKGVDAEELGGCLRGYEISDASVESCRANLGTILQGYGVASETCEQLLDQWILKRDYLLDTSAQDIDLVIGNPPYIRYDDIPREQYLLYQQRWKTLTGRSDIYVAFWEKALDSLRAGGTAAFICADRWMHNTYGRKLRSLVSSQYSVDLIWSMHNVDAFEESVSAYPAITMLSNKKQGSVQVIDSPGGFDSADLPLLWGFRESPNEPASDEALDARTVPDWNYGDAFWPQGSPERIELVTFLTDNFQPIETGTTRIGIGIATGADAVYVNADADVEEDRRLPLVKGEDLRGARLSWGGKYLVNPWDSEGKLVDLDQYPKLHRYLTDHPDLRKRYVAKKNPSAWYRTIDKVSTSLVGTPKLLMRDMSLRVEPVLEPGSLYPHHNVYWITSEDWDLEVLGGLLLSEVCESFVEAFTVRMRGGTLRFQSQYLRTIAVPNPHTMSQDVAEDLAAAFRTVDRDAATRAAIRAYHLQNPERYGLLK